MNKLISWKKAKIAFSAWILLSISVLEAGSQDKLEVLPRWKKGEKLRYNMIQIDRMMKGKSVIRTVTIRADLEIEVLGIKNDGYLISWFTGEIKIDEPKFANDPLFSNLVKLFDNKTIIFELDSEAVIIDVQNWKEFKQSILKSVDVICARFKTAGLPNVSIESYRTQVKSRVATKQDILAYFARQSQFFYMALGVELSPSKPYEFEDKFPNVFGGTPFPCRSVFTLKGIDRKLGKATIVWSQKILADKAQLILEKTRSKNAQLKLKNVGKKMEAPTVRRLPNRKKLRDFHIESSAEYVLEIPTGWILSMKHKTITIYDGKSREIKSTITRQTK